MGDLRVKQKAAKLFQIPNKSYFKLCTWEVYNGEDESKMITHGITYSQESGVKYKTRRDYTN